MAIELASDSDCEVLEAPAKRQLPEIACPLPLTLNGWTSNLALEALVSSDASAC